MTPPLPFFRFGTRASMSPPFFWKKSRSNDSKRARERKGEKRDEIDGFKAVLALIWGRTVGPKKKCAETHVFQPELGLDALS